MTYAQNLRCRECSRDYPLAALHVCEFCFGPLEVVYDDEGVLIGLSEHCDEDVDRNGLIEFADLLAVLAAWGDCDACPEDVDGSGSVDFGDLLAVLAAWGPCA